MRTLRLSLVVAVGMMIMCASGEAYAAAGGHRGGGHSGGYYRSGGHSGGHHLGRHGGSRFDFDVVIGGPFWGTSWYYPYYYSFYNPYYYPYYYPYAPAVTVPSTPREYIERTEPDESADTTPSDVWYYCPKSKAYYPYVKGCPGGWQLVPASPQPKSDEPAPGSDVWYYCPGAKGYYPYVKECPGGWQTVPAQPPSGSER